MDTLFGLPAHPLLVHIPVVLVPLCAVGVIVMALHRGTFARMSWVVLGLLGVSFVATVLAANAGEALQESVPDSAALSNHTSAGDQFQSIMFGFLVVVGAMVVWDWFQERKAKQSVSPEETATAAPAPMGSVSIALRVVAVIAAVASTYFVIDVGHSGAQASWGKVKISSTHGDGGEGGEGGG